MSVRIENLTYRYPRHKDNTLENISLEIKDGDVVALLGLNGCGKSTLIKNIVGLIKPTSGNIIVDNLNINKISISERSKLISYVSQKINNLDDVLVRDYLSFSFANRLNFNKKPNQDQLKELDDMAKRFELSYLLDKKIDEISGGERQKVSICSAMLQNTKVIVLDEPTSALDLKNQYLVLKLISEISNERNKIVIFSTHNPNHALFLNCMVAIMKNGKISIYDKSDQIIKVDNLKNIYGDNICYSKELSYDEITFKR